MREASRYGRPLAERYHRKHHSSRKRYALRAQATAHQYRDVLSRFITFCSESSLLLKTPAQVDSALVTCSNQLYMEGEQHHVGTKLVASLMHNFPEYTRAGTHCLPRKARALKGWRNLSPGKASKAYPLIVSGLDRERERIPIDGLFCWQWRRTVVPKSCWLSNGKDIVPPNRDTMKHWSVFTSTSGTNARSKTRLQDTCVALDTQWMPYLPKLVTVLATGTRNETPWSFLEPQRKTIGPGRPSHLDQIRHSGPSIDRAGKSRTLDVFRQRHAWKSMLSVVRYGKMQQACSRLPCNSGACKSGDLRHRQVSSWSR